VESLQKEALQQGSGYQVFLAKATPILAHYGVTFSAVTSFFADKIAGLARGFFADTMKFLFDLFFTLIFIYVFLMHGRGLSAQAARLLPMQEDRKLELFGRLRNFTLATFHGIFFTAFIQGALGFIGYRLFGLPAPLFFGTLTALFSLIPAGGAMLVWGPLVLFLLFTGETLKGILLLVWGAVLVSGADNVLRPLLIAGRTSVNAVFVLVSAVGGAAAFGVIGLFYGPILLFLTQEIVRLISERGADPADPPGTSV
jgi:predicted PurR-regulated permease PerM